MKHVSILLLLIFLLISRSYSQNEGSKVMYIIDSIPVLQDPEPGNDLLDSAVADMNVIKNRDTLKRLGYETFDGAIYIFTKAYRSRDERMKRIPSTRKMERKSGVWLLDGAPYNGPFLDYYYSGKKQGEGTFKEGRLEGLRKMYYPNETLSVERHYQEGVQDGEEKEYYQDGTLKQQGLYEKGKEVGVWQSYYPNGQVKLQSTYRNGELVDSAFTYYSSGKLKEKVLIKNGKAMQDPLHAKTSELLQKSRKSYEEGNADAAIRYCSKALELDSTSADAYFSRGTLKLNNFQFDAAIADFDQALRLEPYLEVALTNRAFARIRKYQFASSRTLSKNKEVTVTAAKDDAPLSREERQRICADLEKAVFLGDKSTMISEALSTYCQKK